LLKAIKLVGEYAGVGWDIGVSGVGDGDTDCCSVVGGVVIVDRREEGASARKLHVSPFLSQFAHEGCLQSH
jgi:hypothetical protein